MHMLQSLRQELARITSQIALESLRTHGIQIGIPHKFLESVGFSVGMHAAFIHISICNKPLVKHETPLKISRMNLSDPVSGESLLLDTSVVLIKDVHLQLHAPAPIGQARPASATPQ